MKYHTYVDGKYTEVVDVDTICNSIRHLVDRAERQAAYATNEMDKLKQENWKDEQLSQMQDQLDRAKKDYYRGFPISEQEHTAIQAWKDQHYTNQHNASTIEKRIQMQGVSGGLFSYIFLPTGIGTSGICRCNSCYKKALFDTGYIDEYQTASDYYNELERNVKKYDAEYEFQQIG